jgi:hypothetical protein
VSLIAVTHPPVILARACNASSDDQLRCAEGDEMDAQTLNFVALLTALVMPGAFGGLLYGLQAKRSQALLVLDARGGATAGAPATAGGQWTDVAFGIGGALAVYLVLPFSPASIFGGADWPSQITKVLALALLGGWGGPTLLNQIFLKTVGTALDAKAMQVVTSTQQVATQAFAASNAAKEASDTAKQISEQAARTAGELKEYAQKRATERSAAETALDLVAAHVATHPEEARSAVSEERAAGTGVETRTAADGMQHQTNRAKLLRIADDYDLMAEGIERRALGLRDRKKSAG